MPRDTHESPSDEALLKRYATGDPQAAALLTERCLPRVFRHARRVLGDAAAAEDVAQEAMMRLWKMAPDWRSGEAQVGTWLYRVTANLCTDILRKRRMIGMDAIAELADPGPHATDRLQSFARQDALQKALNALPDRQREAVVLRHIEGLGNPQIATIMGLSTRAVESLTARGRRALQQVLCAQKEALGYTDDG